MFCLFVWLFALFVCFYFYLLIVVVHLMVWHEQNYKNNKKKEVTDIWVGVLYEK